MITLFQTPPKSVSVLLGLVLTLWSTDSFSQAFLTPQQISNVLAIDNVSVQDGTVTGEIRNKSSNPVRDPELFIRYIFLWKDEYHPGKDNPSAAFYQTISGEIAPGKALPFRFTPSPPLPRRSDGRFMPPALSIAGYTEIRPAKGR
jgi:hypothetical protein